MSDTSFRFSLFGNHYYFTPKFTFITVFLIALFIALGCWQLRQAKELSHAIQIMNHQVDTWPLATHDLSSGANINYMPIQLTGTFDYDHQILLTQRTYNNLQGYMVVTPFKPSDSDTRILINRGWIGFNEIGRIAGPAGQQVTIAGIVMKPPFFLPFVSSDFNNMTGAHWPIQSGHINIEKTSQALGYPLYPYLILLNDDNQYGFIRDWSSYFAKMKPGRNENFATQWFLLAIIVMLVFVIMNTERV